MLAFASIGTSFRGVKTTDLQTLYRADPIRACRLALRRTVNVPDITYDPNVKDRITVIDRLLGNCGVEAIRGEWQNGYWCDVVAVYSNTGDTYATTVIQIRGDWSGTRSRFLVSSWGDWVERNEKRLGIL